MAFIIKIAIGSGALWLTSLILGSNFDIVHGPEIWQALLVYAGIAFLLATANIILRPIMMLISLPLQILTLGLFRLVVNALLVLLVEWATSFFSWGMRVDGFWWAMLAAVLISIFSWFGEQILPTKLVKRLQAS